MNVYREETRVREQPILFFRNNCSSAREMVALHWHEAWEVLLIRRGRGRQRINGEATDFSAGDAVILRPGDIHATDALSPQGCDVDVLQFVDWLAPAGGSLPAGVLRPEGDAIPKLFDALAQYAAAPFPGQATVLYGLLQVLTGLLMSRAAPEPPEPSGAIGAVCAYLMQADDLRLNQVAARFGYSPEHLSRRFHAETGSSYREYCRRIRMRRAASMLHTESISAIAEGLGYSDESSFIRAFKRAYGITPSAYARRRRPMST